MKTKHILTLFTLLVLISCEEDVIVQPFCENVYNEPYYLIEKGDTTTLQPEIEFDQVFNSMYKVRFGEGTIQQSFGWNDLCGRQFEQGEFVKVQCQGDNDKILVRIVSDRLQGLPFYEVEQCESIFIHIYVNYLTKIYEVRIKLDGSSAALFPFGFEHDKQDSKEIDISLEVPAQKTIQIYKEII